MKRLDTAPEEVYWKIALVGPGGTGKTGMGVSAPRPVILLSERQGMPHVKQAAKRLGVPMPIVLFMEKGDDYRAALRALQGRRDRPFKVYNGVHQGAELVMELPPEQWPLTAVLDSMTDACDVLVKEIRAQSPPRKGRDGLPVDATRFWGVLIDRASGIIKAFRDLPMHVVFLCLPSDKTKEDDEGRVISRTVQPKLATRDMANSLCTAVNVMAYTYRALDQQKQVAYGAMTIPPEGWLAKPCEPLQRREVPDLTSWIARLSGALEVAPEMPLAPEDMAEPEGPPADDPARSGGYVPETPDVVHSCAECGKVMVDKQGDLCSRCDPDVHICERCDDCTVDAPGEFCDECKLSIAASGDLAQPEEASGGNGQVEEPEDPAPGTPMRSCQRCGRRMSVKAYDSGKRRACDADPGHCVPVDPPEPPPPTTELDGLKDKLRGDPVPPDMKRRAIMGDDYKGGPDHV